MAAVDPPVLEGTIASSSGPSDGTPNTLDEPVSTTILRDLRKIGVKLKAVLVPKEGQDETLKQLRDWDLWGPLLLCLLLSIMLSIRAPPNQTSLVFASVFVIVWLGAAVVTVNAQLLGGNISFFQSVCVLGYCVFPLNLAAIMCYLWSNSVFRAVMVVGGCVWSSRASVVFMSQLVSPQRKVLAVYPVLLFYIVLAWVILVGSYSA